MKRRLTAWREPGCSATSFHAAWFRIVEYMRAFLLFRLACAAQNGVVLISGAFGLFNIAVFEGVGPLLEISGYVLTSLAALFGILNWRYCAVMVATSVLFGTAVTLLAVLLSDVATRRYMKGSDLVLLVAVVLLENCGYRQVNAWWGCVGTMQSLTGKGGWGEVRRRAFIS